MIIVEGPDGAGKTTLIAHLQEQLGMEVAPRVVSKDAEAMVNLKTWVEQDVQGGFRELIYDRHRLISEPIYGSILRTRFEPGFDSVNWLQSMYYSFYWKCRPVIIYCLPPYSTVRSNLQGDEDNRVVYPKIRRIYAQYTAQAARDSALAGALVYDYTQPNSLVPLVNQVRALLRSRLDVQ